MQVKAQCNHEVVTTKAGRAPDPLIPADPLGPALETHKKELFMGANLWRFGTFACSICFGRYKDHNAQLSS